MYKGQYVLYNGDIYYVNDCTHVNVIYESEPYFDLHLVAVDHVNYPSVFVVLPQSEIVLF